MKWFMIFTLASGCYNTLYYPIGCDGKSQFRLYFPSREVCESVVAENKYANLECLAGPEPKEAR